MRYYNGPPSSPWTPYLCDQLSREWATDKSAREISIILFGNPFKRNAVIGKARRLGLPSRQSPIIRNGKKAAIKPKSVVIPAPRGCIKCQCGVYALPGLKRCYTCSERGSHA